MPNPSARFAASLAAATLMAITASLAVPSAAIAQQPASRCAALDTTAAWYRKQRTWADESRRDWTNDSLRTALLGAAGLDVRATTGVGALLGYEIIGGAEAVAPSGDSAAIASLRALAQTRGSTWPTRSVVGASGVRAVWVLTGRDSTLARVALHRMMEAGPEESPPAAVAMLEDRLRVQAGRKQLYGTQLVRGADGSLEPAPLEDPKHVELRRDAAGLPPLQASLCAARAGIVR
jgi:hypothetical protein